MCTECIYGYKLINNTCVEITDECELVEFEYENCLCDGTECCEIDKEIADQSIETCENYRDLINYID